MSEKLQTTDKVTTFLQKNDFLKTSLFIILLTLITYFPLAKAGFLKIDDYESIVVNPGVLNISIALRQGYLSTIVNSFTHSLFGMNSAAFHLRSIVLHMFNAMLLYLVAKNLLSNKKVAFFSALIFSVHPINSETVSWLSAGVYLLLGFFSLLTLNLFINGKKNKVYLVASLIIFTLYAYSTKSAWGLTVPFLIVVADRFFVKYKNKIIAFLYFIPAVLFLVIQVFSRAEDRLQDMQSSKPGIVGVNLITEKFIILKNIVVGFFLPFKLSIYHNIFSKSITEYFFLLLTFGFVLAGIHLLKKNRARMGIALMIIMAVLPTLVPIKLGITGSDRHLYFGSAFFCILLTHLILGRKPEVKFQEKHLILMFIIALFMFRSHLRTYDWLTDKSLWISTTKAVQSERALNNLGNIYLEEKEYENAVEIFSESLKLQKNYSLGHYNLAVAYLGLENYEGAYDHFSEAVRIRPNLYQAYYYLGIIETERDPEKAREFLNRALLINPNFVEARTALNEL